MSLFSRQARKEPAPQSLSEYMQREQARERAQRAMHMLDGDDPTSWPTLEPEQMAKLDAEAEAPRKIWYSHQVGEPALPMGVIAGWISDTL